MKAAEDVAFILERERDATIKEWLRRVNLVAELTHVPLSDVDRTRHLHKLFDDLVFRLGDRSDAPSIISLSAAAHGTARFAQGYSPTMQVEESRIFQVSTFRTLHLHHSELNPDQVLLDVITIADETDRQLTEAMRGFMTAQAAA